MDEKSRSGRKARGLSHHHAQPSAATQRIQRARCNRRSWRRSRRPRPSGTMPRPASDWHRAGVLVGPGSERTNQCRGRDHRSGSGESSSIIIHWSASFARCRSRWSVPSMAPRRRVVQHQLAGDIVLVRRSASVLQPFRGSASFPTAAGLGCCRDWSASRARGIGAAGRAVAGGKGGGMGPDLEGGGRRRPHARSRKALRFFRRRRPRAWA